MIPDPPGDRIQPAFVREVQTTAWLPENRRRKVQSSCRSGKRVAVWRLRSMAMMDRGNQRCEGALLIELVITLLMFVVGVLGLSSAMVSAQRSQAWSRARLLASRSLASQLEVIGSTPFDGIKSTYDGKTLTSSLTSG